MLESSARRIQERLSPDDLVLDVGGWARPFERADWVIDLQPWETRGLYHYDAAVADERFSEASWVRRDICDHEPWPFEDDRFAFAICAQTLEDVRDPVWVCRELQRVARAGYIEVPSRLEEQSLGVDGAAWAGWGHHRWLCDVGPEGIEFVTKPHILHADPLYHFSPRFLAGLTPEQRVAQLWWEGGFGCGERVFVDADEFRAYLSAPVEAHEPPGSRPGRLARRLRPGRRP